jgi:hypothetical protein
MGEGYWGATTYQTDARGRRRRVALPEGREAVPVSYPPLVTSEEWR